MKNPELDREFELLERCKALLDANQPLRQLSLDADGEKRIREIQSPYSVRARVTRFA